MSKGGGHQTVFFSRLPLFILTVDLTQVWDTAPYRKQTLSRRSLGSLWPYDGRGATLYKNVAGKKTSTL